MKIIFSLKIRLLLSEQWSVTPISTYAKNWSAFSAVKKIIMYHDNIWLMRKTKITCEKKKKRSYSFYAAHGTIKNWYVTCEALFHFLKQFFLYSTNLCFLCLGRFLYRSQPCFCFFSSERFWCLSCAFFVACLCFFDNVWQMNCSPFFIHMRKKLY